MSMASFLYFVKKNANRDVVFKCTYEKKCLNILTPCRYFKRDIIIVREVVMKRKRHSFKSQLKKYLGIKGLDIVVHLMDGKAIELNKNRRLVKDVIIIVDKNNKEHRIPITKIKAVDLYAA